MATQQERKAARVFFRRMMIWISVVAILMVAAALFYLTAGDEPVRPHMIVAAIIGVFLSVVIGAGLMAAVFFSGRSGHDEEAGRDRHADASED